jgi:folate-binding protein YgfZ
MNREIYQRVMAGETATHVLARQALWRLSGPDRVRYLNGQVTQDVASIPEHEARFAAVCTAKGRMEGELFIARRGADFYLDAPFALRDSLGARLQKYLIADDAVFEDVGDLWSLSHVFGTKTPSVPKIGFAIARARFGLPGHDVWMPASGAAVVGESAGADVVETIRVENGIPAWGAELTTNTLPPEAGPHLIAAISYTKGCYVGQETIARLKSVGHVNRTLVFLRSDSDVHPAPGAKLQHEGREVGAVTSAGFSPRLERGIALGYVQHTLAAEGTVFQADDFSMTIAPSLSLEVA